MDEVETRVIKVLQLHNSESADLDLTTSLFDDLSLDELDLAVVSMDIEHEFDILLPEDGIDEAETVSDIVKIVRSSLAS